MPRSDPDSFDAFYQQVFLPEHAHPANALLHAAGTILGLAFLAAALIAPGAWKLAALLFPAVHAVPGLIGHRLFERNAAVGDIRVTRTDHPPHWFIRGNHRMTLALLTGRLKLDRRQAGLATTLVE